MAEVKIVNVSKSFDGESKVVDDINLEIMDKEFVVLVGPSGCGKSTTLRMVAGLEEISEGEIYIDEKFVNDVSPKNRDIAMVFQNYALYPHMSVFDNLAFGLKLRKYRKEEIEKRVKEAAKILELESFLKRKPKALSGGQRQRVAVGRAIVRHPKVFLFDEPLSNLDAKLRVQMRTEISKLHKRLGATIIYVTHDQTEAMTMGDKIVVMKDGIVQQVDSPLNLYNFPNNKFVAGFIGSPPMNFISGTIYNSNGLYFMNTDEDLKISLLEKYRVPLSTLINQKVILGIRPEHILLESSKYNLMHKHFCSINVAEQMGNETILYFSLGEAELIARVTAIEKPSAGEKIPLFFDLEKLHFYDGENGEAIR
ncbi:MAG: sn-glycerol-3-phosphate ABC transporter ATP-binding protein UgpC [Ignavibacterium sp.]|nr:MAG: sn-glycerol-3-phosphate ABC transporter ATP-binding protein UgpC [Ignavibacterium sp.]